MFTRGSKLKIGSQLIQIKFTAKDVSLSFVDCPLAFFYTLTCISQDQSCSVGSRLSKGNLKQACITRMALSCPCTVNYFTILTVTNKFLP